MTRTRKLGWALLAIVAAPAAALLLWTDPALTADELEYHYTPQWGHRWVKQPDESYLQIDSVLGVLQIRLENVKGGPLLLKRVEMPLPRPDSADPSKPSVEAQTNRYLFDLSTRGFRPAAGRRGGVYRYDPATEELTLSSDHAWEQAQGLAEECGYGFAEDRVQYDTRDHLLALNDTRIDFAGNLLLNVVPAPSGHAAAVVSAAGQEGPNLLPFLGSPKIFGQRYHQILSLGDGTLEAEPVRLISNLGRPEICWTPGEEYVIYLAPFGEGLSIAAVP